MQPPSRCNSTSAGHVARRRRGVVCGRVDRSSGVAVRAAASPSSSRPLRNNRERPPCHIRTSGLRRWPWQSPACRCFPNLRFHKRDRRRRGPCAVAFYLAWGIRQQDVAGSEIGSVKVKDVYRKWPAQNYETGQLGPRAISNEKRVTADVERWGLAKLSAPHPDGAYVLKILIQHAHDHAQHARKSARLNLVFEVADVDRAEVLAHDSDCFAPILR